MGRTGTLLRYGATRLGLAPLMLWLIASLVFLLLRVAPGDPVDAVLGSRAPAAVKAAMRTGPRNCNGFRAGLPPDRPTSRSGWLRRAPGAAPSSHHRDSIPAVICASRN